MSVVDVSAYFAGVDPLAETKTVIWRPDTPATVAKVGYPVCYDSDADHDAQERDTNPSARGATYAEGSQNLGGRLLCVEEPQGDNLHAFAGIIAKLGPKAGADGDTIAIYKPNGATVPVWIDINATLDTSIIAILADSLPATQMSGGSGWNKPIGIAKESIDRTTAGLCWVKVDPNMFITQDTYDDGALEMAPSGGQGGMALNRINVSAGYESGSFCAFEIKTTSTVAESSYGLAFMARSIVSGTVTGGSACAAGIRLNITGGTQVQLLSALRVQLTESGATLTSIGEPQQLCVLNLVNQFAHNPPANTHSWIYLEGDGSYPPDNFLFAKLATDIPLTAHVTDAFSHSIAIRVAGKSYYIMCTETSANKS